MVSQQQCLITAPILQIIKCSWQHITHTFKFFKEGEQILVFPHFNNQNQSLWNDPFWKLSLLFLRMNKSNDQVHKYLSHCPNKSKIALSELGAWWSGSSMMRSLIDWFLNWLHFTFFRPEREGKLDSD